VSCFRCGEQGEPSSDKLITHQHWYWWRSQKQCFFQVCGRYFSSGKIDCATRTKLSQTQRIITGTTGGVAGASYEVKMVLVEASFRRLGPLA
jgi:hypothetical protein